MNDTEAGLRHAIAVLQLRLKRLIDMKHHDEGGKFSPARSKTVMKMRNIVRNKGKAHERQSETLQEGGKIYGHPGGKANKVSGPYRHREKAVESIGKANTKAKDVVTMRGKHGMDVRAKTNPHKKW